MVGVVKDKMAKVVKVRGSRWSGLDCQGGQGQTIKVVKVKVKMGKVVEMVKLNEARWSRRSRWSRSDGQGQGSTQMVKVKVHVR